MISDRLPETESATNRVRAAFVRFLALGGDEKTPIHERGVQLQGAWLTGILDLEGAKVEHRLPLWYCRIESIEALQSHLKFLNLGGSKLQGGLMGDRLHCEGGVFLRDGFCSTGEVRLIGATIGGNLDCVGGTFENKSGAALSCDRAQITGYAFLGENFRAIGEVRLVGAWIGVDLDFGGARLEHGTGYALSCDGARVDGAMMFLGVEQLDGKASLMGMRVGSLFDDCGSWSHVSGHLLLDGFTYVRLGSGAPTDAKARIEWLNMQYPNHLDGEFRPQPWEQLISVLRAMGHPEEARAIAVAKHQRMRAAKRYVGGSRTWDWIYGNLVGYGYRPWKLFRIAFWVWAVGALAYLAAVRPSAVGTDTYYLGPPRSEPSAACLVQRAAARSTDACAPQIPRYQDFFSPTYSLEVMLPVVNLGGKERWQPVVSDAQGKPLILGHILRGLYWLQTAFGWLAGLLLVGVVGTLIKKD